LEDFVGNKGHVGYVNGRTRMPRHSSQHTFTTASHCYLYAALWKACMCLRIWNIQRAEWAVQVVVSCLPNSWEELNVCMLWLWITESFILDLRAKWGGKKGSERNGRSRIHRHMCILKCSCRRSMYKPTIYSCVPWHHCLCCSSQQIMAATVRPFCASHDFYPQLQFPKCLVLLCWSVVCKIISVGLSIFPLYVSSPDWGVRSERRKYLKVGGMSGVPRIVSYIPRRSSTLDLCRWCSRGIVITLWFGWEPK
jgi:hypothetical protein